MKVDRLDLETGKIEKVEKIGTVRFVGKDDNVDLTDGKCYSVIGIRNNLLKLIDDTQDYYYYLPFDAASVEKKDNIEAGFAIIEDYTGKIRELFDIFAVDQEKKARKNAKKLSMRLINWKFARDERKKAKEETSK